MTGINTIFEHFISPCAIAQVADFPKIQDNGRLKNKQSGKIIGGFVCDPVISFDLMPEPGQVKPTMKCIETMWTRCFAVPQEQPADDDVKRALERFFGAAMGEQLYELETRYPSLTISLTKILSARIPFCFACEKNLALRVPCSGVMITSFNVNESKGVLTLNNYPIAGGFMH